MPLRWGLFALFLWLAFVSPLLAAEQPAESEKERPSLEARFESLEAAHRQLAEQFDRVLRENESLQLKLQSITADHTNLNDQYQLLSARLLGHSPTTPVAAQAPVEPMEQSPPVEIPPPQPSKDDFYDNQPPDVRTDEPAPKPKDAPTKSSFFEGFKWETQDGEYTLNFHNETQIETRTYTLNTDPVNQFGYDVPRMRMIFNGRLTRPIEYNVSINKGLGSLDLLDAYLNFNYDPRMQFRIGRYRVPFTYDWYALNNQFLPTPERSVFAINEGYNRNLGAMLHGELLDERVDYALAAVNGPRNSYVDTNADKDLLGYLNVRPFMQSECYDYLKHLNVGGSMTWGIQDQPAIPADFRTSANATESLGTVVEVPSFLELNNGVREQGIRRMWEFHWAYYYKQLSLLGAIDQGFNDYVVTSTNTTVRLPTRGWHIQFAYFLTGEEVERRTFVEPLRPFDLREGKRGPGAWEIQTRFDHFALGDQVFSGGLADPNLWTNQVNTIDSGVNWYLNKYMKIYFDWQHNIYNSPVQYRPGGLSTRNNLLWMRFQIYF